MENNADDWSRKVVFIYIKVYIYIYGFLLFQDIEYRAQSLAMKSAVSNVVTNNVHLSLLCKMWNSKSGQMLSQVRIIVSLILSNERCIEKSVSLTQKFIWMLQIWVLLLTEFKPIKPYQIFDYLKYKCL